MNKAEVIRQIIEIGVIPVIRANSADEVRQVVEAVKAGGITTIEVTMTIPGAVSLIKELCNNYGSEVLIGAGTVLDVKTAQECIKAGAKFIISPALNFETIAFCNQQEIVVMPGALTPTEILAAWNAGADFVKVFPAGAMGGASYLKSIKAPLPQVKLIPTGGVSLKTAADFIKAGAEAVGIGAELVDLKAVREGNTKLITGRAREIVETVRTARES